MSLQYIIHWTSRVSIARHHEGSHCLLKRTLLHAWSLQKSTLTVHSIIGKMFCGLMKLSLNYLEKTHSTTSGIERAWHIIMKTSSQPESIVDETSWFGPALLHQGLASLESLRGRWIPKYIRQFPNPNPQDNARMSVRQLKLCRRWVIQQDNDPKHRSKSTTEWLQKNKIHTHQSPDLNPVETLRIDMKRAIYMRRPQNMTELKHFCQKEQAKIPPQRCAGLIHSYRKWLVEVIASKGESTSY